MKTATGMAMETSTVTQKVERGEIIHLPATSCFFSPEIAIILQRDEPSNEESAEYGRISVAKMIEYKFPIVLVISKDGVGPDSDGIRKLEQFHKMWGQYVTEGLKRISVFVTSNDRSAAANLATATMSFDLSKMGIGLKRGAERIRTFKVIDKALNFIEASAELRRMMPDVVKQLEASAS